MENDEVKERDNETKLKNGEEKDKKFLKIKFKRALIIFCALLLIIVGIILFLIYKNSNSTENNQNNSQNNLNGNYSQSTITPSMILPMTDPCSDKPIIYLYPTEETQVNVQLGYKEKIICSYPKYTTGWNVIAQSSGDLKDTDTNKNLYSLYYESDNVVEFKVEKDGFIVKGEASAEFLEEKLRILGLTDREAEEFIIYWLPKLEANRYNYIRFATKEEIEANMPLTITPTPDTTIRILMEYKGLENPIEVEEQKLEKIERKGFIAVEWGGTEIK